MHPQHLEQKLPVSRPVSRNALLRAGRAQSECSGSFYVLHPGAVQELVCAASCPIYLVNASNDNSKQCVSNCSDAAPYSDAGSCVGRCPTAAYSVVSGQQTLVCQDSCTFYVLNATNANSQQCLAACTDDLPYSDAGLCCARCPKGAYSLQVSVRVCQDACPAFFITNASNGNSLQCVDPCPPPMVSVGQECFGACSSGLPFLENAVCVERCQTGAYTDDGTNLNCGPACTGMYILNASNGNSQKCITACPPETPYYEPGACLVKCSSGFYDLHPGAVQELVCAASCPIYLVNASSDNSKQCVSKCPDAAPYSDAGSCVERCSTAAYSVVSGQQTLVCQDSCTFYVLNATNANSQQCLAACTDDLPYSDAGLCCARCPKGAYSLQVSVRVCQDACPAFFITNASNGNSPQCVDPCPPPMVSVGQECFGACSSGLPFLENAVCVERCQTGAYTDDGTNLNCGPACTGMYILNASNGNSQKCITACPPETPYYEPGACLVKCSSGFYELHPGAVQELVCAASCPIYLVNASSDNSKQCVSKCPDAAPYSDAGSCVERCSTAAYSVVSGQQTLVCQDSCIFYVLNATNANSKQCLAACTGDLPYSDAGLCCAKCPKAAYSLQASVRVCQDACLAFFITNASNGNSRQCVDPCPPPMVSVGQECFGACSSDLPFLENAVCVERCQTGAYTDDGTNLNCGPACTGMYILNASNGDSQKCIAACPPETPYYEPGACQVKCSSGFYELHPGAVQELVCAASCPIYLVNASNDNSKQCVSNCSDAAPYSDAGSCVGRCPTAAYSVVSGQQTLVCQDSCTFYVLNATNANSKQCLAACTDGMPYSHAGLCCDRCPTGAYSLQASVPVCQDACLAFFITNASNGNSRQCVDPCPPPMVSVGQECFGACSSGLPFLENAVCVARCQTGAYTDDGTNLNCGPACTGMYILNASNGDSQKCIAACPPETPYYEPGACQVKCTSGFYVLHPGAVQELVCAASCPIYLVNASNDNSKQCVSNCSDAAPYSDAGSCVGRCPTAAYSVVSGQQTLVCQDSCTFYVLNATNANSKQCLAACTDDLPYSDAGLCCARCPKGAYSLQASVRVCQDACLAFFITNASNGNSRQCVDPCPPPMVSVGQECFGACSSGLPFLENAVCVERCQTGAYTDDGTNLNCGPACTGMYILNASNGNSQKCIDPVLQKRPTTNPGVPSQVLERLLRTPSRRRSRTRLRRELSDIFGERLERQLQAMRFQVPGRRSLL
ncbi:Conserved_hypothetical protein [Hexamita inflata]|uniref:TNFR-Cys domain-containing protein n=1 Tax=Hexamita inflata TaxID=28002 RepID=A0ABP1LHP1_9EUKA